MTGLTGKVGFASPNSENEFCKRRSAGIELIATMALVVSLIVAATAVSIGVARAEALGAVRHGNDAMVALALLFVVLSAGIGGLRAITARAGCRSRR